MMTVQQPNIEFTKDQIDKVFMTLTSFDEALTQHFDSYLTEAYRHDLTERLDYLDIAEISRFIVDKFKAHQLDLFPTFFLQVETILTDCDTHVDNLMVVGLFESIQNIGGLDIDYHFGFDKWLQPVSKLKWDTLIDTWEGKDWRNKKAKQ
jgi:hypothetical protein